MLQPLRYVVGLNVMSCEPRHAVLFTPCFATTSNVQRGADDTVIRISCTQFGRFNFHSIWAAYRGRNWIVLILNRICC